MVTGASSGIGFELAKVFAENGFDLLVNAEDGRLGAAAEQLRITGAQVQPVPADLSSYDGVELKDMVMRDDGRMLITSSIASTMPGSFQAVYNASKSFLQSFAQALQNELKDTNITITSLMPGPTDTNFFHRAGMEDTHVGQAQKDDPAQVAKQGFDALMSDEGKIIAGSATTKVQGIASKVLPDKLKAATHRQMAEPGSGE
ncbi:MAG TPA: SDR family NAD(P)-dependent oxidoreductase [Pseudonocardiaceae bacterium]|nr:SDR family NAD(P)-dependent oxidoreductase [Pseudonocardiaceae bacterium]